MSAPWSDFETALVEFVEDEGVEAVARALVKWVAARTPADKAHALLDAEYAAVRAAADADAKTELGG